MELGMSTDHEIGENASSRAALSTVLSPDSTGRKLRGSRQRFHADLIRHEKVIAVLLSREMDAKFCIYDIANYQGADRYRFPYRRHGRIAEIVVRQQDVQ